MLSRSFKFKNVNSFVRQRGEGSLDETIVYNQRNSEVKEIITNKQTSREIENAENLNRHMKMPKLESKLIHLALVCRHLSQNKV